MYDKVNKYCESGYHVVLELAGSYLVVSPYKDPNGLWRESGWKDSIDEAKENIGEDWGVKSHLEGCKIVEVFSTPYTPYKAGDRVKVRDNVSTRHYTKDLIGKTYKITEVYGDGRYYVESEGIYLDHFALEPAFDEEETIEIAGKKYSKSEFEKATKDLKEVK